MEEKIKYSSLIIESTKYKTLLTKKFKNRKTYEPTDEKKVYAFVPGTISKVFVKEGKKIKAGDMLFILDAMKIQNRTTVPIDGKVKKINVKKGQKVSKKDVLLEIE